MSAVHRWCHVAKEMDLSMEDKGIHNHFFLIDGGRQQAMINP
jgi:hypothetical protein